SVVALQLRDSRRDRADSDAGRRGTPLERGRARGVATAFGDRGAGRETDSRAGARGLSPGARVPGGGAMSERAKRLRAGLEQPLLVSNPFNVLYLAGFKTSNAA